MHAAAVYMLQSARILYWIKLRIHVSPACTALKPTLCDLFNRHHGVREDAYTEELGYRVKRRELAGLLSSAIRCEICGRLQVCLGRKM